MTACIVGWSHTPFGRHEAEDVELLIVRVARDAVADAGLGPHDVDEIVLGHYGGGFSAQGFTSSLVLQAEDVCPLKPVTFVDNVWRHRLRGDPSGAEVDRGRPGALRARGRRREDDRPARAGDRERAAVRGVPQGGEVRSRAALPVCSARSPQRDF